MEHDGETSSKTNNLGHYLSKYDPYTISTKILLEDMLKYLSHVHA